MKRADGEDAYAKGGRTSRRSFLKALSVGSLSLGMQAITLPSSSRAQDKGRLIICGQNEINSLDPASLMDTGSAHSRMNFYDRLFWWRDNPPVLQSWIAVSYKYTPNLLKWTVVLRKGVKFHDGSELSSEDVIYSLERLLALKTGAAGLFLTLLEPKSTRAVDRYTVEFNLKAPFSPFLGQLHFLDILNKKVLLRHEKDGDWGSQWLGMNGSKLGPDGVGSGSFTIESFRPGFGFDGVRFRDHFFGWNHPHVEQIGYRTVFETASRVLGLMKGEYHGEQGELPYEQAERAKQSPLVQVVEYPSMRLFVGMVHNQKPPTSDVHFRRAMLYAFDSESWVKYIMKDQVERQIGPIPNPLWGSLDPKTEKGYAYDLDKAREELKQVQLDYKKYLPLEQNPILGVPTFTNAAEFLQASLRKIGVETTINPKTWPTIVELTKKQDTSPHLWWTYRSTYYADPHAWIGEMFDSDKWGSWPQGCWYKNARVDELLHKSTRVFNKEEREPLYKEAGRLIVADAAGVFVHNERWIGVYNKDVRGVRFCPVGHAGEWRWKYWA